MYEAYRSMFPVLDLHPMYTDPAQQHLKAADTGASFYSAVIDHFG